ncbi:MAG: LON peptidase substrate-binding domain-containing protein [Proteobacteria bacterium]|nr:LON peptidase substrate-binding domain-containing protein [Pseudomonadota bacterium]
MTELPLFPLRTVLFPGGLLPLRIFETRYVDMVGRCLRESGEFGVLLITDAGDSEAGPIRELARVGTSARIVDFHALPDGLLGLMCRGARRFQLQSRRVQPDGLYVGEVEWLPEAAPSALAPEHRPLTRLLRRVLEELGDTARHLDADFDDAGWVSNRLAEFLPLERGAQQQLLELEDPQQRMRALAPLIEVPAETGVTRGSR